MAQYQNSSSKTNKLVLFLLFIWVCSSVIPSSDARKLLIDTKETTTTTNDVVVPASLRDSLILSALPKGSVPSSTPSKKGHAMININGKLFHTSATTTTTRPHQAPAHVDRFLRSVPSPGVGH